MEFNWNGKDSFSIKTGSTKIAANPYKENTADKADIAIFSQDEPEIYQTQDQETYICDWPGEYEVKDILITGVEVEGKEKLGLFTMYSIHTPEQITVGHLGQLSEKLLASQVEKLGSIDVLLVPVGGGEVLDAKTAVEVIEEIEPKVIIPMWYTDDSLEAFLKAIAIPAVDRVDSLKINKSDLPAEGQKIIIINKK